jgi:hypothetical protein
MISVPVPVSSVPEPIEPTAYSPSIISKKPVQSRLWKITTLALISLAILCFFCPWVNISISVLGENVYIGSQSGYQVCVGLCTYSPRMEFMVLLTEALKKVYNIKDEKVSVTAIWFLLYPTCLVLSGVLTAITKPKTFSVIVSSLVLGALLLLILQFGILGSPLASAYTQGLGALSVLHNKYTIWFYFSIFLLIAIIAIQMEIRYRFLRSK